MGQLNGTRGKTAWTRRLVWAALAVGLMSVGCGKDAESDGDGEGEGGTAPTPDAGPTGGTPVGGEPVGGEPVGGEPVGGEPVGGEPVGGGEPPPRFECGRGVLVFDLNAEGTPANGGFALEGQTSDTDEFFGSCTPEMSVGSEAVVKFTAPSAGFWTATSAGSELDTIMYALSDCNDGFTEIPGACNDDANAEEQTSRILLDLEADEVVYIFIDQFDGEGAETFQFSIEPVTSAPPVINSVEAFVNPEVPSVGWIVRGQDAEGDATRFRLGLIGADGAPVQLSQDTNELEAGLVGEVDFQTAVLNEDGTFELTGSLVFNPNLPALSDLTFAVGDEIGLWSETSTAALEVTDVERARGDGCDPALARDRCPEADVCLDRDRDAAFTCEVATAPTVATAVATYNAETNAFSVRVTGTDPENDAVGIRFRTYDAEGAEVFLGDAPGEVGSGFARSVGVDGNIDSATVFFGFFQGLCLAPAQQQYQDCTNGGRSEETCETEANASLEMCNREKAASIARFDLVVVDASNKTSENIEALVEATETVEVGGLCDPLEGLGICPENTSCADLVGSSSYMTCAEPVTACPESWAPVDLNANEMNGRFVYRGDSSGAENHGGNGRCGGGGPNVVHRFVAPAAGNWQATISGIGAQDDTLLFARSHCGFVAEEFELACNDDIVLGSNLASSVTVELEEGAEAFFFVDGFQGGFAGAYILTLSRGN
jgi:hypothetical protein